MILLIEPNFYRELKVFLIALMMLQTEMKFLEIPMFTFEFTAVFLA